MLQQRENLQSEALQYNAEKKNLGTHMRATLKYNENLKGSGASICELKMFGNLFLRAKII